MDIIITSDGSHTLQSNLINDTYHSTNGAITEALTVYIKNGLDFCFEMHQGVINVLEIGFGTGLNAFLTAIEAERMKRKVEYYTLEPFPIDATLIKHLNYNDNYSEYPLLFNLIHETPWNKRVDITPYFSIIKLDTTLESIDFGCSQFHLVYFDAFGPDKQPEVWDEQLFSKIANQLVKNSILTTYSTKGTVKRALKNQGFVIEKLPGPPGKREVLRARFNG
jgi:tRNA U34 5-methylaminomethyl-2-thiouridine-forming methyltransferase MnmC